MNTRFAVPLAGLALLITPYLPIGGCSLSGLSRRPPPRFRGCRTGSRISPACGTRRQRQAAGGGATVFDRAKMAPFKPGGEALFYEPRTGDPRHDEPRAFCMPSGFPVSVLFGPYPDPDRPDAEDTW